MKRAATIALAPALLAGLVQADEDPFAPLAAETRPLQTRWQTDYSGALQLGSAWTTEDNFTFGQYNGLENEGITIIGNLQWQDFRGGDSYWRAYLSDMGLTTREGALTWGLVDNLQVTVGFDSQQQVRNDTGRTPFRGSDNLLLPANWTSGINTGDFTDLDASLASFQREISRDKLFLSLDGDLAGGWTYGANLSYEEREGTGDIAGAIYTSLTVGDAALLPLPVDQSVTEVDLSLGYQDGPLAFNGQLAYSDFDNSEDLLTWQNPYSNFRGRYPNSGGLDLAPDNEQLSGRLSGHYIFNGTTRLQFDGSYALASQDDDFPDYTVNPSLVVTEPVPRDSFDGEVANATFKTRLLLRPLRGLNAEAFYRMRDRDYDTNRDGYRYVRGDATNQPGQTLTVYNTAHGLTEQEVGVKGDYRLPDRWGRLSGGYSYEEVERENAAVETTEEDRYTLGYRVRPARDWQLRLELEYADRAADTYQWDQSYYALLDPELINATPDSQRYINHPLLFQYYLANREQWEASADLTYTPDSAWSITANVGWRDEEYDKSELGLTDTRWLRVHLAASYAYSTDLTATFYAGYDEYAADQSSRQFFGGQEKNAFEIFPPLPQASDPNQDWDLDATDIAITVGANLQWRFAPDMELAADYNYVDTRGQQTFTTRDAGTVEASDLPDVDTRLHHLELTGTWHMNEELSLQLDYQFYKYETDDWAWDDVQADTVAKVLTFGQDNPDDDIHYVGASVIYRWQ